MSTETGLLSWADIHLPPSKYDQILREIAGMQNISPGILGPFEEWEFFVWVEERDSAVVQGHLDGILELS